MPEGRMLQRRISESKKVGGLNSDSARLLYTWLIVWCDCEGRHSADPDLIKGNILPKCKDWDGMKVTENLYKLSDAGLIHLYKSNGETYLQMVKTIQKINKEREAASRIPPMEKGEQLPLYSGVGPENSGVTQENSLLIKGNEIKGNEKKTPGLPEKDGLDSIDKEFDIFWEHYPLKINKVDAKKAFRVLRVRKKVPCEGPVSIAAGLNGYNNFIKHEKVYKNFDIGIMYPATFLRNDKWKEHVGFVYRPPL
jgi:hypothetical protein